MVPGIYVLSHFLRMDSLFGKQRHPLKAAEWFTQPAFYVDLTEKQGQIFFLLFFVCRFFQPENTVQILIIIKWSAVLHMIQALEQNPSQRITCDLTGRNMEYAEKIIFIPSDWLQLFLDPLVISQTAGKNIMKKMLVVNSAERNTLQMLFKKAPAAKGPALKSMS